MAGTLFLRSTQKLENALMDGACRAGMSTKTLLEYGLNLRNDMFPGVVPTYSIGAHYVHAFPDILYGSDILLLATRPPGWHVPLEQIGAVMDMPTQTTRDTFASLQFRCPLVDRIEIRNEIPYRWRNMEHDGLSRMLGDMLTVQRRKLLESIEYKGCWDNKIQFDRDEHLLSWYADLGAGPKIKSLLEEWLEAGEESCGGEGMLSQIDWQRQLATWFLRQEDHRVVREFLCKLKQLAG